MEYGKRDKLDILLDILEVTKNPVKKTHILYKANINFHQLTHYIELLESLGMVEKVDNPPSSYVTTAKGIMFMDLFKNYKMYSTLLDAR